MYAGNPCQLAIVHTLGIPFIYFDLNGLTDETRIAAQMNWNLPTYQELKFTPTLTKFISYSLETFWDRILQFCSLSCEFFIQNGGYNFFKLMPCSKRYSYLDGPITHLFQTDYRIKLKFKNDFPDVNEVFFLLIKSYLVNNFLFKIKQNAELYFLNTDILLESFQSFTPNVILVGGLHIDYAKPLFLVISFISCCFFLNKFCSHGIIQ